MAIFKGFLFLMGFVKLRQKKYFKKNKTNT